MKRKRIGKSGLNSKGITNMVTQDLLPVVGGYVVGDMLISKLGTNLPVAPRWIKLAGGAILGVTQKGMLSRVGLGLAASGAIELVSDAIKGPGVGLLNPGQSPYYLAGPDDGDGYEPAPKNMKWA